MAMPDAFFIGMIISTLFLKKTLLIDFDFEATISLKMLKFDLLKFLKRPSPLASFLAGVFRNSFLG